MDKNSATYHVAIGLIQQSADNYDPETNSFSWFITAIMRFISLDNDLSLLDFLIILKEEIPRTNEVFDYYDKKLWEKSFSEFIENYLLVSKK